MTTVQWHLDDTVRTSAGEVTGHLPQLEAPAKLLQTLQAFLVEHA